MAVLTKHILGTPTGKIGDSVCFSTWKGKACIRSLASSVNDPNTLAQQAQRNKFKLMGGTLVPLSEAVAIGWKGYEKSGKNACTAQNAYMKYHLKNVDEAELFTGETPDFDGINADKLLLSRGALTGCTGVSAGAAGYTLEYGDDQDKTDLCYLVLYCPALQDAVMASGTVENPTVNLTVPDAWSGEDIYAYVITTNQSGKKASNSYNFKWEF